MAKRSLTNKIYLIVVLSVACCALLIGTYYYIESMIRLRGEIGGDLERKARAIAITINEALLSNIKSPNDVFYTVGKNFLISTKAKYEIEIPINIFKRSEVNRASLILTTEPNRLFGAEYRMNSVMKMAFDSGSSVYSPIYSDQDGTWISAYAPIKNISGSVVGVVELNRNIGYYINMLKVRLLQILILCFCGCFVGIYIGMRLFKPILSSISMLSSASHKIESGNYDDEIKLESADEIGSLANDLEKMRISFKKYIKQLNEAHDELVRSEKLAALGKLAGIVSHELRNPLGVISNSVYFIKTRLAGAHDEKVKRHLEILEMEVSGADNIINNILSFGRIKEPLLAETNICEAIETSIKRVEVPGNVEMKNKSAGQKIMVQADKGQLGLVFYNIILNGVQAMPNGGKFTVEVVEKDGFAQARFSDTGTGISKENLKSIFDPLFSTKPKGTGLGLSVCQGIIEKHKGAIMVESELGKGTTFIIKLPMEGRA